MTDLSDFVKVATPDPIVRESRKHPDGWQPGVDTERGVIVAPPSESETPPADWSAILVEFGLDPAVWEVVSDRVNVRTWDANIGNGVVRRFRYWKADVRPRQSQDRADIDALIRRVSKHRYRSSAPDATETSSALVVCLADWQAGPDPEGLVDHILNLKVQVVDELKQAKPDVLYVIGMGDLVEQCDGHYPMQAYLTGAGGLNGRRDQVKLVRRLLVDLLTEWARRVPRVVVGCVPGNHGEARRDGKAFTTFEDNDDLAVFEQTAEILAANDDAYGHVRFVIPDGDMSLTLDVAGTVVGFIHGHQARKGGQPRAKVENWWRGKQNAKHPIGDADILVSGHLHHFVAVEDGPRTWFQAPALARSRWWEEAAGQPSREGTLTFHVGPAGWDHVRLLR